MQSFNMIMMSRWMRIQGQRSSSTFVTPTSSAIKQFDDIPTIPDFSWPWLGHLPALTRPNGLANAWKTLLELKQKHVPPDINLLRLCLPSLNSKNQGRAVYIFDPKDVETVYRNEGVYPHRGDGFSAMGYLRDRRPDLFGETRGLVVENGERWQKMRKGVQQTLMRPEAAYHYLQRLNEISNEFVGHIRRHRQSDLTNRGDFINDVRAFSFEATAAIAIDANIGCLKADADEKTLAKLQMGNAMIRLFSDLNLSIPAWHFLPPRWSKKFRTTEDMFHQYAAFIQGEVTKAAKKIEAANISREDPDRDMSILERLIVNNDPNSSIPFVMAYDLLVGGMDTTGTTLAFLLFNLATHPEAQDRLRQEVNQVAGEMTKDNLRKMPYFQACLRESLRRHPTAPTISRLLPRNVILSNHQIPAGTLVLWSTQSIHSDANVFQDPHLFKPERWLEEKIHPFASRQFGHGPRMCIGKRLAELEIQVLICHLMKHFVITWQADHDIETSLEVINVPSGQLKFKFQDVIKCSPMSLS